MLMGGDEVILDLFTADGFSSEPPMEGRDHMLAMSVACGRARQSPSSEPDELLRAAMEFWKGCFHIEKWPNEIQDLAKHLIDKLFAGGAIRQTVPAMSGDQRRDLLARLEHFADCFRRGCCPKPVEPAGAAAAEVLRLSSSASRPW